MNEQPLHRFHGGLKLEYFKSLSNQQSIETATLPDIVILPVRQHIGNAASVLVNVGDVVKKGQKIAAADGYVSAPIHASIGGTVTAIEQRQVAHPSGLPALCVEITTNGDDSWSDERPAPHPEYRTLEAVEVRNIIREAGITGLGGAAFPTAVKLNPPLQSPIHTLIINGAECEPYISCDDLLMREESAGILQGVEVLQHLLQPQNTLIGIEDNKPEAISAMRAALAAADIKHTDVVAIPTLYPTGGERQLIKVLTGKEVPSSGLPADIGIVCQNVGTTFAVFEAVLKGKPLIERVVTVSGKGVNTPKNLRVRIGSKMSELTRQAGGYSALAQRLVMGGPMMGISLPSDDLPVVKSCNCVLVAASSELLDKSDPQACIRCGKCAEACPSQLLPQQLYWFSASKNFDKAQDYKLFDCIECGCCDWVCPSNIPLVQHYRFAKTEIWKQERQASKADIARDRHEFRQARQERDRLEKEARMAAKRAALAKKKAEGGDDDKDDPKKAAIRAAMARAAAKKAEREKAANNPAPDATENKGD